MKLSRWREMMPPDPETVNKLFNHVWSNPYTRLASVLKQRKCNNALFGIQNKTPVRKRTGAVFLCLRRSLSSNLLRFRAPVIHYVHAFFDPGVNAVSIKPILGQQQLGIAVRHQPVRYSHSDDAHLVLQTVFLQ